MPLSREFKELVVAKAENDPDFRKGLIIEAINMILNGNIAAGRIMLRDYINAVGAMDEICRQLNKQKSAICRMLGPSGNPTLESIVPVIRACADREQIKPVVCIDSTVTKGAITVDTKWKPSEIIVDRRVEDDPVTRSIIEKCPSVPVKYIDDARPNTVVAASDILLNAGSTMLDKIIAGKQVLFVAPPSSGTVDQFEMTDDRILCPHFDRLKYASNGCFYQCDWCYLKLTYRANQPFIKVYANYDQIIKQLEKTLSTRTDPVIFNSGEMADSLALEHLTGAGQKFIPWFGASDNGYLFMLTKSDNVDEIIDLPHNGHTIVAWSMNNESVSRKFEIGAPPFVRRLNAAQKTQDAGYPVRIRLDPIVPFNGWQQAYAGTVRTIFERIQPERVTLGTLRFEAGFYKNRHSIFTSGPELPRILEGMQPMFEPKSMASGKESVGKYSFSEGERMDIFGFIIKEIRKYSDCRIALCKESARVWDELGLEKSRCSCVCQLDYADMS